MGGGEDGMEGGAVHECGVFLKRGAEGAHGECDEAGGDEFGELGEPRGVLDGTVLGVGEKRG